MEVKGEMFNDPERITTSPGGERLFTICIKGYSQIVGIVDRKENTIYLQSRHEICGELYAAGFRGENLIRAMDTYHSIRRKAERAALRRVLTTKSLS